MRRRGAAEAVDLGLTLARRSYVAMLLPTLAPLAPLVLGLAALAWVAPVEALIITWWLKPCCEHWALWVIGRITFGEAPATLASLRRAPWPDLRRVLGQLTWARLSPWRSYVAAVTVLEGLRG